MTQKTKSVFLSLGLAALVAGCGSPSNISKEADHDRANVKMESRLDIQQMFEIICPRGPEPRGPAGVFLRFLREKRDRNLQRSVEFRKGSLYAKA